MTEPIVLAPRLDLAAASALKATLSEVSAKNVEIDFSQVKILGALCLQVLLAASATFAAQGKNVKVSNLSERVAEQMRVMGVSADSITRGHQ